MKDSCLVFYSVTSTYNVFGPDYSSRHKFQSHVIFMNVYMVVPGAKSVMLVRNPAFCDFSRVRTQL